MTSRRTTPQTILVLCSLLGITSSIVKVDVRCYCNLLECIVTGRMCRSSVGVCVTEKVDGRHGCIELFSVDAKQMAPPDCRDNATRRCCTEDMCNYYTKTSADVRKMNHSHVTGYLSNHDTSLLRGGHSSEPRTWFRATLVTVPVAGSFVLVTLIVMATKMLRAESRRQTRLKPAETRLVVYRNHRRFLPKSFSCVLLGSGGGQCRPAFRNYSSMVSLGRSGHLCRSASVSLSTDTICTDSSKEKYFVFDV